MMRERRPRDSSHVRRGRHYERRAEQAMTGLARLRNRFLSDWTTVLVGWRGLSSLSPWPDRENTMPPLLATKDIIEFANERLASSSDPREHKLIVELLEHDLDDLTGRECERLLVPLAELNPSDPALALRKWRLALLEEQLETLPQDPLNALIELTEFWQSFGFPTDSPHTVQGRGNAILPQDYYTQDSLRRILAHHRDWVAQEIAQITGAEGNDRFSGKQLT